MNRRRLLLGTAATLSVLAGCTRSDIRRASQAVEEAEEGETGGDDDATATDRSESETDSSEQGRLVLAGLRADADGNDDNNLNDEYVVFENAGEEPLDLTNWTVRDAEGIEYTFPDGFTLEPGQTVMLCTGSEPETPATPEERDVDRILFWGRASEVWNDGADTLVVTDAEGQTVIERSYP